MAKHKKPITYKAKTYQLWSNLKRRDPRMVMTLDDLRLNVPESKIQGKLSWWFCKFCLSPLKRWEDVSLDHYIPLSRGGATAPENLVVCCKHCNRRKGEMTGDRYLDLLELIKDWGQDKLYILRQLGMKPRFVR